MQLLKASMLLEMQKMRILHFSSAIAITGQGIGNGVNHADNRKDVGWQ
ncbi:hypothetical protein GO988_21720 [Hymenobacter sp. HMF4947]|uniref:Uncharacterized protein n=1 Tax=Hymenobacter ginkgonis TaxID=2682976 RepID=A0A7K1TKL4_9BACT|nr:hypothetical protein [Hymenobacter ginkgonis]MVN78957.1 hypothetical protein [Hymenobacter ginkgonis]